jgi:hypothetical protein
MNEGMGTALGRLGSLGFLLCVLCVSAVHFLPARGPATVQGTVLDSGGKPVAGARVRFKATSQHASTDARGRFTLKGNGQRITAWSLGHFIGGASVQDHSLMLRLRPLPTEDSTDYAWVDPTPDARDAHRCGNCHATIHQEWAASAHGQAASNKRFLNLYDGSDWQGRPGRGWNLLKEHPNGSAVCAACHAPTVPADHAAYEDFRKLEGVHARGIHCDFCHKIAQAQVSTERLGLEHGRFGYQLLRPAKGQLFFGPLDDVDREEDTFLSMYQESRYCAACHEGTVFGIPVYTTYSEWLESPARKEGKQCQTCHMTPTGKMTNIAPGHGGVERDPKTLASHGMPGATPEMLRKAVRLMVRLRTEKDRLHVETQIEAADVGHRVPTGFIDRHLILVVEGLDGKGSTVAADKGPKLPSSAGLGERTAGRLFGKQLQDFEGKSPVPFWRPSRVVEDSRLVPGKPTTDAWEFPAEATSKVRVRLLYRRFYQAVAEEKGWPQNETVVVDREQAAQVQAREHHGRDPEECSILSPE